MSPARHYSGFAVRCPVPFHAAAATMGGVADPFHTNVALAEPPRTDEARPLAGGMQAWPVGDEALRAAIECVILDYWRANCGGVEGNVGELADVYERLTGWRPTPAAAAMRY